MHKFDSGGILKIGVKFVHIGVAFEKFTEDKVIHRDLRSIICQINVIEHRPSNTNWR